VAQGAVVAQLDMEPFELALAQAKLQREQAERTFDRLTQLQGSNTVSQVSVDDAQTQMDLARIAERNAERSLEEAQLLSPFAGLVARRYVPNFTTISAGTPIARLHDMSELRVEIDVPEILFQSAGEDPDVDLFAKFPASDSRFPLEVREFNAETSQVGQTFGITLGMPPPTGLVVLPGSSVTVFATLKGGAPSLHIPASAIVPAPDGTPQVMVFAPTGADEGTVTPQPVTVTPDAMGRVTVTSGLEPGQESVASGAALLQAGDSVRRFTGFAN
ncbi:MAG: efflux RND transporter periplasmic adaptor subunit, partial [Pseudomonadota bacterium]